LTIENYLINLMSLFKKFIVFMKALAFGERSMKSRTIGNNVALELLSYGACSSHPQCRCLLTFQASLF
jgi:hypothetical protein